MPARQLYNISRPEQEAMKKYISNGLASGIIRPSTSPLAAGGKKTARSGHASIIAT